MQGSRKVQKIVRVSRGEIIVNPVVEEHKKQKLNRLRKERKVERRKERQRVIRESRRDAV